MTDAPPVVLSCPQDREEAAGQTQAAIDTKFSAWLQSASFTGGCNPIFLITIPVHRQVQAVRPRLLLR